MQHVPHEHLVFGGPGGPKMEPKWLPECFENQAPVRGASGRASGSGFGRLGRLLEGPRGSPEAQREPQERPRRVKAPGGPRTLKMSPRRANMSFRRARVSSGRSREASGSDLGSIFRKCNTFRTKTLLFEVRGIPK